MKMDEADILIYVDSGWEFNKKGQAIFANYLSFAAKHDALFFELPFAHRFWTKNHARLTGSKEYFARNQVVGGNMFLKKSEKMPVG